MSYPITRQQILDSSKLKKFADGNFKFDENGRKLSKQVENTAGKGEIAHYKQFLLIPQCFQEACFPGASNGVIVWERVKRKMLITSIYLLFLQCFQRAVSSWVMKSWDCVVKGKPYTKRQNFGRDQIESICRQQIKHR